MHKISGYKYKLAFLLFCCIPSLGLARVIHKQVNGTSREVHILFTSDIHGYFDSKILSPHSHGNGLYYLANIINHRRAKLKQPVLLDGGDLLYGSPSSFYYFFGQKTKRSYPFITLFNKLRYDAWVVGNHDFQVPLVSLIQSHRIKPPPLADNIGRTNLFKPYTIVYKQHLRIAILGFVTPGTPMWSLSVPSSFVFKDIVKQTKYWVHYVQHKEKPDLLIILFHSGLDAKYDSITSKLNHRPLVNSANLALQAVHGVHLALIGHTHRMYPYKNKQPVKYVHHIPVVWGGAFGKALQEIVLQIHRQQHKWQVTHTKVLVYNAKAKAKGSRKYKRKRKQYIQKKYAHLLAYMHSSLPFRSNKIKQKQAKPCWQYIVGKSVLHKKVPISLLFSIQKPYTNIRRNLERYDLFSLLRYRDQLVYPMLTTRQIYKLSHSIALYGNYRLKKSQKLHLYSNQAIPSILHRNTNPFLLHTQDELYSVAMTSYVYAGGGGYMGALFIPIDRTIQKQGFVIDHVFHYLQSNPTLPAICSFLYRKSVK